MRFLVVILCKLCVASAVYAQSEGDTLRYTIDDRLTPEGTTIPSADITRWHPEDVTIDWHSARPAISMTSFYDGVSQEPPKRRFIILPNNTLEAWGRVNVSNGQAQNWGVFPNSYLDARTLSFPIPR